MRPLISLKLPGFLAALLLAAMALVTLQTLRSAWVGALELPGQGCPDEDSQTAVEQIGEDPEAYVGCRLILQGTLYRMQGVDQILYFMKLSSGESFDVRSWAPDEAAPREGESADDARSMASYVGRELRIEGKLVRERNGRIVVEASIVEELGGASE